MGRHCFDCESYRQEIARLNAQIVALKSLCADDGQRADVAATIATVEAEERARREIVSADEARGSK